MAPATPSPAQSPSDRSLLKQPRFRNIWAAVEISVLGMYIHVVASAWIMTTLTPSATMVSLVQTAYALPIVLLSLVAGTLADTLDRVVTMRLSLALAFLASLAMATTSYLGLLTPWIILALVFAIGAGIALFTPSWQASLGDIASRERLFEAVSLHNMGANAMRTIGPSLGGLMVAGWGATTAFFWGAVTYIPALFMLVLKPPRLSKSAENERLWPAMMLGLRYLAVAPQLELLLLRAFSFSFGGVAVIALLPLIAQLQMGGEATTYGFLYGGYGGGAILGGLILKPLRKVLPAEQIARLAFLSTALAILALIFSQNLWLGLPASILAGASWLTVHSLHNTVLQLSSPSWIAGRMVATFMTSIYLGMTIGSWLWGWLVEHASLQIALAGAILALLATLLLAWRSPLPDLPKISLEPLNNEPLADDDKPLRGGPLCIMIEHEIDPAHQAEFNVLMGQRRRHTTQLGGKQWALLKDIRRPGCFTESFYVANWSEYRRMMIRQSEVTKALRAQVAAMQRSLKEPSVHLMLYTPTGISNYSKFLRGSQEL